MMSARSGIDSARIGGDLFARQSLLWAISGSSASSAPCSMLSVAVRQHRLTDAADMER